MTVAPLSPLPSDAPSDRAEARLEEWMLTAGFEPSHEWAHKQERPGLKGIWNCNDCTCLTVVEYDDDYHYPSPRIAFSRLANTAGACLDGRANIDALTLDRPGEVGPRDCYCHALPSTLPPTMPTITWALTHGDLWEVSSADRPLPWVCSLPTGVDSAPCPCGAAAIAFVNLPPWPDDNYDTWHSPLFPKPQPTWFCHECLGVPDLDIRALAYIAGDGPDHEPSDITAAREHLEALLALGWTPRGYNTTPRAQ